MAQPEKWWLISEADATKIRSILNDLEIEYKDIKWDKGEQGLAITDALHTIDSGLHETKRKPMDFQKDIPPGVVFTSSGWSKIRKQWCIKCNERTIHKSSPYGWRCLEELIR
jgi:hypothetical protein